MANRKGGPVVNEAHHPVVILQEHPLLGEGIAKYLSAQLGVEAIIASGDDLEAVTAALAWGLWSSSSSAATDSGSSTSPLLPRTLT